MATYNGSRYVVEQVESILEQLADDDQLVVVDDASHDGTADLVEQVGDPRARIVRHERNQGYVASFEEALRLADGEVVLLADQDDVWRPGRVAAMAQALVGHDVVATNLATLGGPERIRGPYGQQDWHLRSGASASRVRNILGILAGNRPYYGSAMGVRRSALPHVLPFPEFLDESHDLWIALYGNVMGSMAHLELRSVERRFHTSNASPERPRGLATVLRSRLLLLRCTNELISRRRAARRSGDDR